MRRGTWIVGITLLAVLVGLIYVFGNGNNGEGHVYHVGVFQVVRHPVLDAMAESFCDDLEQHYPGRVKFDTKVAGGDAGKTEQMAQQFATGGCDLVFVIGTNQAQSLAKKTSTIPIVLGGATDPEAAGLVQSWERPGKNVTGTSDLSPVGAQLDHLKEVLPKVTRVGIIHNPSEDNSKTIVARFQDACAERNLTPVSVTISSQNEIRQTVVALVGKIDALYAPTDGTVQSAFPMLVKVANELNVPVFNCDEGTAETGALFSVGFNYVDIGRTSAEMAAQILDGRAKPESMPIRLVGKSNLYYNERQIEAFGLTVPEAWVKSGKKVNTE